MGLTPVIETKIITRFNSDARSFLAHSYKDADIGDCGKSKKECAATSLNNKRVFPCRKNGGNCPFEM